MVESYGAHLIEILLSGYEIVLLVKIESKNNFIDKNFSDSNF